MLNFSIENLLKQEIKILRKEIIRGYLTGILAGIMVSCLFGIAMFAKNSLLTSKDFYFMLLIITGAVFITSLTVRNLLIDLYRGVKHIYQYPVTEKLSYQDNEPGVGGEKMKYYLISEKKKFQVSEKEYNYAQVNDFVFEDEAPKSGLSLKVVVHKSSL